MDGSFVANLVSLFIYCYYYFSFAETFLCSFQVHVQEGEAKAADVLKGIQGKIMLWCLGKMS